MGIALITNQSLWPWEAAPTGQAWVNCPLLELEADQLQLIPENGEGWPPGDTGKKLGCF